MSPAQGASLTREQWQARIDETRWYHDFEFPNGLRARSNHENPEGVRTVWRFIEDHLDRVDFAGKTVLDVGAWDGFWSFHAERRGARSVLATDDATQNWAASSGLPIARELLQSHVEVRQDLSIYELASLGRRFDVILCLGVFYHLRDPQFGLTQLRHCCHDGTLVLIEGELAWNGVHENEVRYFHSAWQEFLPSPSAFTGMLKLAYLHVESSDWMHPFPTAPSPRANLQSDRVFLRCRPFRGVNDMYVYRPHFGLHVYDDRWASS